MYAKIKNIIMEQLDVEENEIKYNSRIVEDLGADSLDIVEILSEIEDSFDIEISKEQVTKLNTIDDIVEFINKERK